MAPFVISFVIGIFRGSFHYKIQIGKAVPPDAPSRLRSPDHQREKPSHFPSGFSVDFSRSLHFRHGFAHLAGANGADASRTADSFSSE